MRKVTIKRQSPRTWGIFVNGNLVEGGFFSRDAAERAAQAYVEK